MLERIQQSDIIITFPQQLTPFCFPIKVDSLRESLTSEKLEDRVKKNAATVGMIKLFHLFHHLPDRLSLIITSLITASPLSALTTA